MRPRISSSQLIPAPEPSIACATNRAGREWASADHPLALISYQTLSPADYARFFANYIISTADWAKKDFGKPNIERFGAESREWQPTLSKLEIAEDGKDYHLLARLEIHDPEALASGRAAFPQKMYLELTLPNAEPVIYLDFSWFQKPATRMPEALWLTFNPNVPDQQGWMMDKSGEPVSPFDVVAAGSRHLHAVSTGFSYRDREHSFAVETLDAPLIALGEKSPLNFSRAQPDLSGGVHCNLFNNAWGTNYIMWFGEDMRFRFRCVPTRGLPCWAGDRPGGKLRVWLPRRRQESRKRRKHQEKGAEEAGKEETNP